MLFSEQLFVRTPVEDCFWSLSFHRSHVTKTFYKICQFQSVLPQFRSSHQRCSMQKGVLRNFAKFTEKYLCQSLLFNKVAGLRLPTLLKKRVWHSCFPVNFVKVLRTAFFTKHLRWLLLTTVCPICFHQMFIIWTFCFCLKLNISAFGEKS